MTLKSVKAKCVIAMLATTMFLSFNALAIAQTVMNGKEVKVYTGQIISHNDRTDGIVVKTDNSTGHWKLSHHTVVFSGKERLNLSDVWGKTKKVEVFVSKDGEVQRISVLEWK